ncbi:MAG: rubrerythrin family protein, partial [SAR324 cluster bacterium]|nr:rubrerythrin family protein [SAR324 cluster bacterium]
EGADVADSEGFHEIATTFRQIAKVEKQHENRYRKLLKNIKEGQVFEKDTPVKWKCRNCGFVHEGKKAQKTCPACEHPQAHFEIKDENY